MWKSLGLLLSLLALLLAAGAGPVQAGEPVYDANYLAQLPRTQGELLACTD